MAGYEEDPIEETEGDTFSKSFKFTKSDGSDKDITGWTLYVTVKNDYEDADADAVLSKDVTTHDNATAGETSFEFTNTETEGLGGTYFFEVKYEDDTGYVETILSRRLEFDEAVRSSV